MLYDTVEVHITPHLTLIPPKPVSLSWQQKINVATAYANMRGWQVQYSSDKLDQANTEFSKVVVYNRTDTELMFYYLLHELGHLILWFSSNYCQRFRNLSFSRERRSYSTSKYRIGILEEELAAWEEGYELAKTLNLEINEVRFDRTKVSNVLTYVRWAAKKQQTTKEKKQQKHATSPATLNNQSPI